MERKTRQRDAILSVFNNTSGPLSPAEILEQCQKEISGIGIATIYRNVKSFVEEGVLKTVPMPGQPDRYEVSGKKHHHYFHCTQCNRSFDITGCPGSMEQFAPDGFRVMQHEVFLYGVCKECQQQAAPLHA